MWTQDTSELKAQILAYVRLNDYVSFAELRRYFADDFDMKGDLALSAPDDPNLIFWVNMSELFIEVVIELLADKQLHLHPASLLVYLIDGGALKLPIAKRPPAAGYKSERWLPVTLRTVPLT